MLLCYILRQGHPNETSFPPYMKHFPLNSPSRFRPLKNVFCLYVILRWSPDPSLRKILPENGDISHLFLLRWLTFIMQKVCANAHFSIRIRTHGTDGNAHARKLSACLTAACMRARTLATEAKTSGKYRHFQVKFYVMKGPATIVRSHRNGKCSLTGENGKGN